MKTIKKNKTPVGEEMLWFQNIIIYEHLGCIQVLLSTNTTTLHQTTLKSVLDYWI